MNENEIRRRFPNASAAFIRGNTDDHAGRVSARPVPQPAQGLPLVEVFQREAAGEGRAAPCYHITFTVYSTRPRDWDNLAASCKQLQDAIVETGYLPDDNWRVLSGSVESRKARTKLAERTVVRIERVA